MADYIKKPLGKSLNKLAINRAQQAIQQTGRALPCTITKVVSSGIVEVSFDVTSRFTLPRVIMPVQAWEFIRYPLYKGLRGKTVPADVRLGQASGLGGGVPKLSRPANLAALTFVPIGRTDWTETDDPQAVVIYGPNGVILRDAASTNTVKVSPTEISLSDNIKVTSDKFGAFGSSGATKQSIIGALSSVTDPAAKAVLTSVILAFTQYNLVEDDTT